MPNISVRERRKRLASGAITFMITVLILLVAIPLTLISLALPPWP